MSADDHQFGGGLAIEGQSDLVEATLGFVVDADRTLPVALEGDAAEIDDCRRWRRWWCCDGDRCIGGPLFAEVVDDVAGDGDGARRCAASVESRGGCAARDLTGGGGVGVVERTILRAVGDRRDHRWIARHHGAGICGAGDGWRLEGVNAEACGAAGLLTGSHALGDVTGDGVVSRGESRGCDGGGGVVTGDMPAAGAPDESSFFLQVKVTGGCGDCDGIAGKDVRRLNCAT